MSSFLIYVERGTEVVWDSAKEIDFVRKVSDEQLNCHGKTLKKKNQGLPWRPVVKTLWFQCKGRKFDLWSGNTKIPPAVQCGQKEKIGDYKALCK